MDLSETALTAAGGIPGLIAGVLLLLVGRRLYWLFVAIAGFLFGFVVATRLFGPEAGWGPLAVAVVVALAAALVAVLFQKVAIVLAGFVAGGVLMLRALIGLGHDTTWWVWLLALVAAFVGAAITRWLFEAGLIVLSSLLGAALLLQSLALDFGGDGDVVAFFVLAAVGIVVQAFAARGARSDGRSRSTS